MNNYVDNDTFGFGSNNKQNEFDYNSITGLGESDYQNEDLFGVETSDTNASFGTFDSGVMGQFSPAEETIDNGNDFSNEMNNVFSEPQNVYEQPIEQNDVENSFEYNSLPPESNEKEVDNGFQIEFNNYEEEINEPQNFYEAPEVPFGQSDLVENEQISELPIEEEAVVELPQEESKTAVDTEFLYDENYFTNSSLENDYTLPIAEPTESLVETQSAEEKITKEVNILAETPIEELTKLTEYEKEKIGTTDIKALFDRVGVNVKEASDIFKKNTEMKEKIDSRFEELKKLQSEVEKSKQSQYDEINSYKEEVLLKLTEKKEEIEKRLNKLREFQASLEKEKQEFEEYRKKEKEEIERVQKEVQDAYDGRREELNHIEDVLRKQKDALDDERAQLSLDRIQYESDKNELANNLLKFNEIVDSFTNGMDKLDN